MRSFFTGKKITKTPKVETDPCEICGLYKKCNSPKMEPTGKGKLNSLIIGENPTKNDDLEGEQFVGAGGQLLRSELSKYGLDLNEDFIKTNSIICKLSGKKPPTEKQLKCCRPNWQKVIE